MGKIPMSYAGHLSDRVLDLYYGKVEVEGIDLQFLPLMPFQAFNRMMRGEFDCGEMSFSTYLIQVARGETPFVGIPVFPSRAFRHSAIYVNMDAGIRQPQDLIGQRVGVPEYHMSAATWVRGMLQHEYGVQPTEITWVTGGLRDVGRKPIIQNDLPGIRIEHITDRTLDEMLVSGEIAALMAPQMPPSYRAGHPKVDRLFPNYPEVEKAYFQKTGIFPIMHVLVMKRSVYEQHPWAAVSLYQAFMEAKNNCLETVLHMEEPLPISLPWIYSQGQEVKALMGEDIWPYGVEKNVKVIEALAQYQWEQGLVPRKVAIEELFAPNVVKLSENRL